MGDKNSYFQTTKETGKFVTESKDHQHFYCSTVRRQLTYLHYLLIIVS
jgi:hypothetical protein